MTVATRLHKLAVGFCPVCAVDRIYGPIPAGHAGLYELLHGLSGNALLNGQSSALRTIRVSNIH
jgi:hypothetical protein